jgi:hypothetical protein
VLVFSSCKASFSLPEYVYYSVYYWFFAVTLPAKLGWAFISWKKNFVQDITAITTEAENIASAIPVATLTKAAVALKGLPIKASA